MYKFIFYLFVFSIVITRTGLSQDYNNYTNNIHTFKPGLIKKQFRGFYGYFFTSGEFAKVDTSFFSNLLKNKPEIPTVKVVPSFYITSIAYMHNRIYTNFGFSYSNKNKMENDSLKSFLRQTSFSLNIGYNLARKIWEWETVSKRDSIVFKKKMSCVISPYIGIKSFRLRHVTTYKEKDLSLEQYLEKPEFDLRVNQLTFPIGLNMTFNFYDIYSVGFQIAYLYTISDHPTIKTPHYKINNSTNLPINNLCFSLGLGMGFNRFYKNEYSREWIHF